VPAPLPESGADRRLLLYEVAAGDAWPLRGLKDGTWAAHKESMLAGEPAIAPRMTAVPVRLPFPEPLRGGSIYETQTLAKNTWFRRKEPQAAE